MVRIAWKRLIIGEIAAIVCEQLRKHGMTATLSGGACVSIYTANRYQSSDLDFCTIATLKMLTEPLKRLGFLRKSGRHFENPACPLFIEFVPPPLAVGTELVTKVKTLDTPFGQLRLLSPTDCVKDRLAAFYFWNDHQSLEQAVMVAQSRKVSLVEVERWSRREGQSDKFQVFLRKLHPPKRKSSTARSR